MNRNVLEIIDALTAHEDMDSIRVLEELGTNSPDNEVREYTSRALVRKNVHDSLKIVIINQGKGINDLSPAVAMSTINEILALKDKSEVVKILLINKPPSLYRFHRQYKHGQIFRFYQG